MALLCTLIGIGVADGALITLVAKVTYELLDANGVALADGSIVQIVGSGNQEIGTSGSSSSGQSADDQFETYGSTNYLADTTLGDDEIIGTVTIGTGGTDTGLFFTATFEFDDTEFSWFYIRFFDTTGNPPEAYTNWNNSQMYAGTNHPFGVQFIDFAPSATISTVQTNNFVVIPEPASGSLFLLLAGLVWGIRLAMKKPRMK